jgi:serine protease
VYDQVYEDENLVNVFDLSYMRSGGPQDIGVVRAWQLLQSKGKLGAHIRMMVLDGGFLPNQDWPWDRTVRKTEWGTLNTDKCGTEPCPYHGTHVVLAAMAEVDNDFGTAGPAGPLAANIVVVGDSLDFWTELRRLEDMVDLYKPHVVNLSYSARFWGLKSAHEDAANKRFRHMQQDGATIVAAAGNEGDNVDWSVLILPCESRYVLCVGGMGIDTTVRDQGSNYGSIDDNTSVEIYGPYCTHNIVDPGDAWSSAVDWVCGTSIAAPFVAGVAALVRAANPGLTPEQVRNLLKDTAHVGGLGGQTYGSQRRINALAAVAAALGVKIGPPLVDITSPATGSKHGVTSEYEFKATTKDYLGNSLPVFWMSSLDGPLGSPKLGPHSWGPLSAGTHTISATAMDNLGQSKTDTITIQVQGAQLTIVSPPQGSNFDEGKSISLAGYSSDPITSQGLFDDEVKWEVFRDGTVSPVFGATGHDAVLPYDKAKPGNYKAVFSGGGGKAERPFTVTAWSPDKPAVDITSPASNVTLWTKTGNAPITLKGMATDSQDGSLSGSRFRWTATGAKTSKVLCAGNQVPGQGGGGKFATPSDCSTVDTVLGLEDGNLGETKWTVKLEVWDSDNHMGSDTIVVTVVHSVG